jgi:hypothetical protein
LPEPFETIRCGPAGRRCRGRDPALIEKTRTDVTGGTGQYRIADLRPGTDTLTYSLPGFTTL